MQVNKRPAVIQLKRADDPQRQVLLAFSQDCLVVDPASFEAQPQSTVNTLSWFGAIEPRSLVSNVRSIQLDSHESAI